MEIPEELQNPEEVEEALEEMFEGFIQSPLCDPQTTPNIYLMKKAIVKFFYELNKDR